MGSAATAERKHLCLICGKVGNDTPANRFPFAGENDVFLCSMPTCGRYYHKKCLESRPPGEVLFYSQSNDTTSDGSSSSLAKKIPLSSSISATHATKRWDQ